MEIERACRVKVKIYLKSEQPEAIEICYGQLPACLHISDSYQHLFNSLYHGTHCMQICIIRN